MKSPLLIGVLVAVFFATYKLVDIPIEFFLPEPGCKTESSYIPLSEIDSPLYQGYVRAVLQDFQPGDFRYFFKTFIYEGDKTYAIISMKNNFYCLNAKIRILDWGNLFPMRTTNGAYYPNELYRLKWEIKQIGGREEIIFREMYPILD